MREVLAADVVARGDGGGKVPGTGMHPVLGFDNVARFYLGLVKKYATLRVTVEDVNGSPALMTHDGEKIFGVITFDFDGGRIVEIDTVLNPDKLVFAMRQAGHV